MVVANEVLYAIDLIFLVAILLGIFGFVGYSTLSNSVPQCNSEDQQTGVYSIVCPLTDFLFPEDKDIKSVGG